KSHVSFQAKFNHQTAKSNPVAAELLMHSFAEHCAPSEIVVPAHDESVYLQEDCRGQHVLAALRASAVRGGKDSRAVRLRFEFDLYRRAERRDSKEVSKHSRGPAVAERFASSFWRGRSGRWNFARDLRQRW